jgi:hypothetical protein
MIRETKVLHVDPLAHRDFFAVLPSTASLSSSDGKHRGFFTGQTVKNAQKS